MGEMRIGPHGFFMQYHKWPLGKIEFPIEYPNRSIDSMDSIHSCLGWMLMKTVPPQLCTARLLQTLLTQPHTNINCRVCDVASHSRLTLRLAGTHYLTERGQRRPLWSIHSSRWSFQVHFHLHSVLLTTSQTTLMALQRPQCSPCQDMNSSRPLQKPWAREETAALKHLIMFLLFCVCCFPIYNQQIQLSLRLKRVRPAALSPPWGIMPQAHAWIEERRHHVCLLPSSYTHGK